MTKLQTVTAPSLVVQMLIFQLIMASLYLYIQQKFHNPIYLYQEECYSYSTVNNYVILAKITHLYTFAVPSLVVQMSIFPLVMVRLYLNIQQKLYNPFYLYHEECYSYSTDNRYVTFARTTQDCTFTVLSLVVLKLIFQFVMTSLYLYIQQKLYNPFYLYQEECYSYSTDNMYVILAKITQVCTLTVPSLVVPKLIFQLVMASLHLNIQQKL